MKPKIPAIAMSLSLLMAGTALPVYAQSGSTMDQKSMSPPSDGAAPMTKSAPSMKTIDITDLREATEEDKTVMLDGKTIEELKDTDVETNTGEGIGEIDQVLIDKSNTVKAVTVKAGAFLGFGGEKVVLTLDQLSYRADKKAFVVAMNEEQLKTLPKWERKSKGIMGGTSGTY